MTPEELRNARKAMGLTQSALAKALRLSPKNGDRSVRIWETDGNTIPGPVQVAVECLLNHPDAGKSRNIPEQVKIPVTKPAGKAAK